MGHDLGDGLGDGGRGVDHRDLDAGAVQPGQGLVEFQKTRLHEMRRGRLPRIPPMRQRALRIGVNQCDFAGPGPRRLDGQVP